MRFTAKTRARAAVSLVLTLIVVFSLCVSVLGFTKREITIKVGWWEQPGIMETYEYDDGSIERRGYMYEYLQSLKYYTGWSLNLFDKQKEGAYTYKSFDELVLELQAGTVDVLCGVSEDELLPEGIVLSDWSAGTSGMSIYVKSDSAIAPDDYETMAKSSLNIGVRRGSDQLDLSRFLTENDIAATTSEYGTVAEMVAAMNAGKISAFAARGYVSEQAYSSNSSLYTIASFAPETLRFAIRADDTVTLKELNESMGLLKVNEPSLETRLTTKYLTSSSVFLKLTESEKKFISESEPITVVYSQGWSMLVQGSGNSISGVVSDVFTEISAQTGLEFEFAEANTVLEGKRAIISCFNSDEGMADRTGYYLSEDYLKLPLMVVSKFGGTGSAGAKTAIPDYYTDVDDLEASGYTLVNTYKNEEECLTAVKNGEVDQAIIHSFAANTLMLQNKYGSLSAAALSENTFNVCMALDETLDPKVLSIIDKALEYVNAVKMDEIIIKNSIGTQKITIRTILNQLPTDVMLLFSSLFFIIIILVIVAVYRTKQKKLEEEKNRLLAEKNDQLQEALTIAEEATTARTYMSSRMSHEIRTPLNAVIGYLSISNHATDEGKKQDAFTKASDAAKHLLHVINDVLEMTSIDGSKTKLSRGGFDFNELISAWTLVFSARAKQKGVKFTVNLVDITEYALIGDEMRLNQILMNLLTNAVKFTPVGGEVILNVKQDAIKDEMVYYTISVVDSGIGMSDSLMERIFSPFDKAEEEKEQHFGGTGVGLSITKNLVSVMGGSMEATSKQGEGSTFLVRLFFKQDRTASASAAHREFNDVNALVIDDEKDVCEYTQLLLDRCMAKSFLTTSEKDALVAIKGSKESGDAFNICLLDWQLPDEKAIEVLKSIRAALGHEVPIVITTVYDVAEIREKAYAAGASMVVAKPLLYNTVYDILMAYFVEHCVTIHTEDENIDFTGMRLLLAEDNEMNRDLATEVLTTAGFIIDTAEDGVLAVEKFNASPVGTYDLVLMDIQMPNMNGLDATKKIRALDREDASLPIIAMTANAFGEDISKSFSVGMNDHILKPFEVEDMLATLRRHLVEARRKK